MEKIHEALAPHNKAIQQWHHASGKFAAVVYDKQTKKALEEALKPLALKTFITVAPKTVEQDEVKLSETDKISIVYKGTIEVAQMHRSGFGKKFNQQFGPKFIEIFRNSLALEPVILTKDLEIIDGDLRYLAAVELGLRRLPAIIVNATQEQARFLRLVLNKSNEFQRWYWDEVDDWLDANPSLIPQLEKLAIFGERIVPETYLGNTLTTYEIHEDSGLKTQQSFYKQEYGLALWASKKREMLAEEEENKKAAKKETAFENTPGLFEVL